MIRSLILSLLLVVAVQAAAIPPNCPGGLQDMTANVGMNFGGSGIPRTAVCFGTFSNIELGLTATQRFTNPAVTNNGTDTFFAQTGDDLANGQAAYAVWNFNFYARNFGSQSELLTILWDTNPGADTDESQLGFFTQVLAPGATIQDSWNLGMGFIDTGAAVPGVYSPSAGPFSPYASGQYTFSLGIVGGGSVAMNVNTAADVPEPTSLALFVAGLAGIAFFGRRRY